MEKYNVKRYGMDEIASIKRETIKSCPEHEVWLSFHADAMAATFCDWWYSKGFELWKKYNDKHQKDY